MMMMMMMVIHYFFASKSPTPRRAVSAGRIASPSHQSAVNVVLSPTPTTQFQQTFVESKRTTSEISLQTQKQTIHAGMKNFLLLSLN